MNALLELHTCIGEQGPIVARAGHIVIHHRCRSRLVGGAETPSLDALIYVAAAGSAIKAGASQRPTRILRLTSLIAPADATGEQSRQGCSYERGLDRQPFWRQCTPTPKRGRRTIFIRRRLAPFAHVRRSSLSRRLCWPAARSGFRGGSTLGGTPPRVCRLDATKSCSWRSSAIAHSIPRRACSGTPATAALASTTSARSAGL